jgi:2-C-methyl-D-erythritol 2,4-cyclodiphosphate synthase
MYRIGIGYDIHRLVKGRALVLGGVDIPYTKGLMGHSDADVLVHAVCDALLGAAALGDIGKHFPDTDKRYKGISSVKLLKEVRALIGSKKYKIMNIDCTVVAQEPKIMPFKDEMTANIAGALKIGRGDINIKATTNEGIGEIGGKKAIAAYAVALLTND